MRFFHPNNAQEIIDLFFEAVQEVQKKVNLNKERNSILPIRLYECPFFGKIESTLGAIILIDQKFDDYQGLQQDLENIKKIVVVMHDLVEKTYDQKSTREMIQVFIFICGLIWVNL